MTPRNFRRSLFSGTVFSVSTKRAKIINNYRDKLKLKARQIGVSRHVLKATGNERNSCTCRCMFEITCCTVPLQHFLRHCHCSMCIMIMINNNSNDPAYHFFEDLGRKISEVSGDSREGSFIFQRLSVTIQRSNAALLRQPFTRHDDPDL